jgi:hypothetical protein
VLPSTVAKRTIDENAIGFHPDIVAPGGVGSVRV